MKVAVDISLYPLDADYVPPIDDFIARLHSHQQIRVETHAMSTQVSGDLAAVMGALEQEMARTFSGELRSVFVLKVFGGGG
ncbi:MAG: YkoF family thiamine/hydroxymethylpyrimidine-binding protein [Steroidobacteraceae bacterium]